MIIRELIADPTTVITRGSTYDNRANLAPAFLQQIVRKYEGTLPRSPTHGASSSVSNLHQLDGRDLKASFRNAPMQPTRRAIAVCGLK